MDKYEVVSTAVATGTGAFAIANIQEILSTVILVISVINILWNLGYSIYKHFKNKEYDKIDDEFKEGIDKLNGLKGDDKK